MYDVQIKTAELNDIVTFSGTCLKAVTFGPEIFGLYKDAAA